MVVGLAVVVGLASGVVLGRAHSLPGSFPDGEGVVDGSRYGASAGQWRCRTVPIVLSSIQAMPSGV